MSVYVQLLARVVERLGYGSTFLTIMKYYGMREKQPNLKNCKKIFIILFIRNIIPRFQSNLLKLQTYNNKKIMDSQQGQPAQVFNPIYPYRFQFSDEIGWKKYLQEQGFVVIANWLDEDLCEKFVQELWEMMEFLSDGMLDRNNLATQKLGKNYPVVLHGGMIQYIGHSKTQWELRKLCKPIFANLWNTDQVKTSFDGLCFMNGVRNYKKVQQNSFLHSDQSPTKNYLWSYQGIMCLTDADDDGGGFVAVPKSHLYHRQYFTQKKLLKRKENWYIFPEQDKILEPICNDIKVNNKAGDFILFDSRTFHCNTKPTTPTLRVCTYICMIPSEKIPEKVRELRKKAVKERRTSNHHAGDGFKTFPVLPRYLDDPARFKVLVEKVNSYKLEDDQSIIDLI